MAGLVWRTRLPGAGKHSRFALLFEGFVVQVLRACRSASSAAGLFGLSRDQLPRTMERTLERGMDELQLDSLSHVGLDEQSFGKGQSYMSVLSELDESRVLEVMDGRNQAARLA